MSSGLVVLMSSGEAQTICPPVAPGCSIEKCDASCALNSSRVMLEAAPARPTGEASGLAADDVSGLATVVAVDALVGIGAGVLVGAVSLLSLPPPQAATMSDNTTSTINQENRAPNFVFNEPS